MSMSSRTFPPPPPGRMSGEKRRLSDESESSTDSNSTICSSRPVKRRPGTATTTNGPPAKGSGSTGATKSESTCDQNQVRVVARIRPLSTKERNENSKEILSAKSDSGTISLDNNRKYEYDEVFEPNTSQREVYERSAGDMLAENIYKGFNVTILAYGQTGSGKTFTMGTNGGPAADEPPPPPDSSHQLDDKKPLTPPKEGDGIIPRAVYDIFKGRDSVKQGYERVKVEMSYLEIYNEEARDLLATSNELLHIRDSKTEGVVVHGLSTHPVSSPSDVSHLMESASSRRVVASTAMNAVSSRSHAICTLHVTVKGQQSEQDEENESEEEIHAKLTLVDLAGSERIKRTGAEGARMKEGININKGLFVLGQVVSALSEVGQSSSGASNHSHIPYRDSKLTRLLQDSLGGNSRTIMVACVSPADSNTEESINTLRYASRARNIKNSAVRNVVATGMSQAEAAALRRENQMLKVQLLQLQMQLKTKGPSLTGITGNENVASVGNGDNNELEGINIEKLAVVSSLRAKCVSLESKIELVKEQASSSADAALNASMKADKWQMKYEQLVQIAKDKGVSVEGAPDNMNGNIITNLRKQVTELKAELQEARTDAAVARATAAAVVAGNGDLTAAEEMALVSETSDSKNTKNDLDDEVMKDDQKEKLTAALVAMSGEIEQKEAMAAQMNKERECMETLHSHFEGALLKLQEEVNLLQTEKQGLLDQMGQKGSTNSKRVGKTKVSEENNKMRERVLALEKRIKELRHKAAEHTKTIRMKEQAEKKCSQLEVEIQQDKKRRAAMQRKLKEAAEERRNEKKAADQKARKFLRDSQKLKLELQKVKDAAAKQAQVLKRKAAEALSRQKSAADLKRKKLNARAQSSGAISIQRKEELDIWLDQEMDSASALSAIKSQIEEQTELLNDAVSKRESISPSSTQSQRALENEIETRKGLIAQLNTNAVDLRKAVSSNEARNSSSSGFINVATWKGLSRAEIRYVGSSAFERLVQIKTEVGQMQTQEEEKISSAVRKAVSSEKQKAEALITELKLQHSEKVMSLLESTKGAMEHKVRVDAAGIDSATQASIDKMLGSFLSGCDEVGNSVKGQLDEVRNQHEDMKKFVDNIAQGLIATNEAAAALAAKKKKKPKTKPKSPMHDDEQEFIFDDDEEDGDISSDDSDWNPDTPKRKKRHHKKSKETLEMEKAAGDSIPTLGEPQVRNNSAQQSNKQENLDKLKVAELRDLLRLRGMTVSGKKADLLRRLRLQASTVSRCKESPEENEEKENIAHNEGDLHNTLGPTGVLQKGKEIRRPLVVETIGADTNQVQRPSPSNSGNLQNTQGPTGVLKKGKTIRRPLSVKTNEANTNQVQLSSPSNSGKKSNVAFWSSSPQNPVESNGSNGTPSSKRTAKVPITKSAKKRRRKSMVAAVSNALLEVENALKI